MTISGENAEQFDEIQNKLADWLKENVKDKGFDYYSIISFSKPNSEKKVESLVFMYSSLDGDSPYAIVKTHVANIVDFAQRVLKDYQFLPPTESLVKIPEAKK